MLKAAGKVVLVNIFLHLISKHLPLENQKLNHSGFVYYHFLNSIVLHEGEIFCHDRNFFSVP